MTHKPQLKCLVFPFQITVIAQDEGLPLPKVGPSARVVVNVIRNLQAPRFLGTPYRKNITETQARDTTLFTVRAEDRDARVRAFFSILETQDIKW